MSTDAFDRFLVLFNKIDKHIKDELQLRESTEFGKALGLWSQRRRGWKYTHLLKALSHLRNMLVHDHVLPGRRLALPSSEALELLEQILTDLERPPRVIPRFQTDVATLQLTDSLASVLRRISEADYSQFPVYEGDRFRGLLTENGIVRYLTSLDLQQCSLVEFEEIKVGALLSKDENLRNYRFVKRDLRIDRALEFFASRPVLEAILITAHGRDDEKLLGIMTRWDVLEALKHSDTPGSISRPG